MKEKITRGQLAVLIESCKSEYDHTLDSIANEIFNRYKAVKFYVKHFEFAYSCSIKISTSSDQDEALCEFYINPKVVISYLYDFSEKELKHIILKQILDYIYDNYDLSYYRYFDEYVDIYVSCEFQLYEAMKMIAYGSDATALYYVEQECGEGWIVLPHKPNRSDTITIINRDK